MSVNYARVLLAAVAAVFAALGTAFALAPAYMAGLVDIVLPTPTARADLAATYGGLELGLAVYLLACLRSGAIRPGLLAAGWCLAGFAAVRGAHLVTGGGARLLWAILVAEVVGAVLLFWAARASQVSEAD
jgi:hypothetical protein